MADAPKDSGTGGSDKTSPPPPRPNPAEVASKKRPVSGAIQKPEAATKQDSANRVERNSAQTSSPNTESPAIPKAASKRPVQPPAPPRAKSPEPGLAIESDEPVLPPWKVVVQEIWNTTPSYLISLVSHVILLVLLALIPVLTREKQVFSVVAGTSNDDTVEELLLEAELPDLKQEPQPLFQPDQLMVEVPIPPDPRDKPDTSGTTNLDPTAKFQMQQALAGRKSSSKQQLLQEFGGTAGTEQAVQEGLKWLARNQSRDGTWSMRGPYNDGIFQENRSAATGLALLAFLGAGHTTNEGEYKTQVAKGFKALLARQNEDGFFYQRDDEQGEIIQHQLYTQAIATIALCELYAMTGDQQYKEPAQRAINFAVQHQAPEGGWRYTLGQESDLSVTGWFVVAFQSAMMAGLEVDQQSLAKISGFLDSVAHDGGAQYAYRERVEPSAAMTAEGLLSRQYLGWTKDHASLKKGVEWIGEHPMDWNEKDYYYWYYAAQVMHNVEGEAWDKWNLNMRQLLPANQETSGKDRGSWSPEGDQYSTSGGRLYSTCLCLFVLEVYYRHLPLYRYRIQ